MGKENNRNKCTSYLFFYKIYRNIMSMTTDFIQTNLLILLLLEFKIVHRLDLKT